MSSKRMGKEDIFRAATELQQEGIDPTIKLLRERLGSGSFATISKHFKLWQIEKPGQSEILKIDAVLNDVNTDVLSEYLQNESPQITALIFSHLPPKKVAQILQNWPETFQNEILSRMENLGYVQDKVVNKIAMVMAKELRSIAKVHIEQKGGSDFVNAIRKEMGV